MSAPIIKSLVPDKTPQQVEKDGGTTAFIGWQKLIPYVCDAIAIAKNEEITGIVVDDIGIKVYLRLKGKPSKL